MVRFCVEASSIKLKSTPPCGLLNGKEKSSFGLNVFLSLTLVDVPQKVDHRSRTRSTKTLPPTERVVLPTQYNLNENTFKQTSSLLIVSDKVKSTNRQNLVVVQQVNAQGQSLHSHDQELVRSNCRISLRNLCKTRLSQWAAADNEISSLNSESTWSVELTLCPTLVVCKPFTNKHTMIPVSGFTRGLKNAIGCLLVKPR